MGRQFLQDLRRTTRNRTYIEVKMVFSMLLLFCLSAPSISNTYIEDTSDGHWMFVPNQVVSIPGQCLKNCYKIMTLLDGIKMGGCSWNIETKECSLFNDSFVYGDSSSGSLCFSFIWS